MSDKPTCYVKGVKEGYDKCCILGCPNAKCEWNVYNHSNSKKYDTGKLRYDLIPPEILEGLARVYTFGSEKYGDNTWQGIEPKRYEGAAFRHFQDYRKGKILDDESGIEHLYHAMWNIGAIAYLTSGIDK
jgi:hypothetical protein